MTEARVSATSRSIFGRSIRDVALGQKRKAHGEQMFSASPRKPTSNGHSLRSRLGEIRNCSWRADESALPKNREFGGLVSGTSRSGQTGKTRTEQYRVSAS